MPADNQKQAEKLKAEIVADWAKLRAKVIQYNGVKNGTG